MPSSIWAQANSCVKNLNELRVLSTVTRIIPYYRPNIIIFVNYRIIVLALIRIELRINTSGIQKRILKILEDFLRLGNFQVVGTKTLKRPLLSPCTVLFMVLNNLIPADPLPIIYQIDYRLSHSDFIKIESVMTSSLLDLEYVFFSEPSNELI